MSRSRPTRRGWVAIGLLPAALIGVLLTAMWQPGAALDVAGPDDGALVNADQAAALVFVARSDLPESLQGATLLLDREQDVTAHATVEGRSLRYAPELGEGEHELTLTVPRPFPSRDLRHTWRFTVDTTPPALEVDEPAGPILRDQPIRVAGTVEPDAVLTIADRGVEVTADGSFALELDEVPAGALDVTAADPAGNTTSASVTVAVIPSRIEADEVRGLHVSFYGWATPSLREPVLELAEAGKINSVQLDLKDESGALGYDSQVPLAREIGAVEPINDLEAAVAELHERGLHVVGRIVAFRDPVLAAWAWDNGHRDYVLQTTNGAPYAGYGGFTNFAHPDVVQYNVDVALEAAAAGVDAILWDYVRRPDGPIEALGIPGMEGTAEESVVAFVAEADRQLEPFGVQHGASVYGIAATRATQIAQDITGMAEHLDYVAPMVYPSHWGAGEYDVADPNRQPHDIVYRALEDFLIAVGGTRARVIPWLEDTNYRAWDRPRQVRDQIRATRDWGINEFLMWDPLVRYTPDAYAANPTTPDARREPDGSAGGGTGPRDPDD